MDWIMQNRYAQGLDCVDLSTVMPKVGSRWIPIFAELNQRLERYPVNPQSFRMEQAEVSTQKTYETRSRFRMFYSVHSAIQETREKMVPRATPLSEAIPMLKQFRAAGPNLMLHQLFVEGMNDSDAEIDALLELLSTNFATNELRVLRYNACDRSPYREWDHIDHAVGRIAQQHDYLKVQTSAGKEVAAACGQFLVAYPRNVAKGTRIPIKPVPSAEHNPVMLV